MEFIPSELKNNISKIWNDRYSADENAWWKIFNESTIVKVEEELKGTSYESEKVKKLISAIKNRTGMHTQDVANAYSQLTNILKSP